jgi:hypothetical protein
MVVWGGTQDIRRNETGKDFYHIKNFARNHNHTNVIVMSVPYRYDLESKSCVNSVVKVYNRKLKNLLKVFSNMCHVSRF